MRSGEHQFLVAEVIRVIGKAGGALQVWPLRNDCHISLRSWECCSRYSRRIRKLLVAPDSALDYGRVADLVHATDDVVVKEIESWQSVFGGKSRFRFHPSTYAPTLLVE